MRARHLLALPFVLAATGMPAGAADYACEGLVQTGRTMICPGFEPNWAIKLACEGTTMTSTFVDAFSGDGIQETPGGVTFSARDPWTFETSHPVRGTIDYTPAGCSDEGDNVHDFTFTPTAAPGLSGSQLRPFCCRLE